MKYFKTSKIAGGLIAYFCVVGFLYAGEFTIDRISEWYYSSKPPGFWIEYVQTYPDPSNIAYGERPLMYSETIRRRSARLEWNDIMKCDVNGDGEFTFTQNYESARFIEVAEYEENIQSWFFGNSDYVSPPVGSVCYIVNEINVCPPELKGTKEDCKLQITRSKPMTID